MTGGSRAHPGRRPVSQRDSRVPTGTAGGASTTWRPCPREAARWSSRAGIWSRRLWSARRCSEPLSRCCRRPRPVTRGRAPGHTSGAGRFPCPLRDRAPCICVDGRYAVPAFERTDRSSGFLLFWSGSCRPRLSVDAGRRDAPFPIARFRASRAYPSLPLFSSPPVTSLPSSPVGLFPMIIVSPRARHSSSARSMVGRWPRANSERKALDGRRAARAASSALSSCLSSSALMTCAKRSVADRFTVLFLGFMVSSRCSPHCLRRLVGGLTRCPSVGGSRRSPFLSARLLPSILAVPVVGHRAVTHHGPAACWPLARALC